jgi:hypothetical protein
VQSGLEAFSELDVTLRLSMGRAPRSGRDDSLRLIFKALSEDVADSVGRVVILDEMDAVRRYPDAAEFLRYLRHLISADATRGLNALIVSRRPVRHIEEQVRGISTLAGACYPHYLAPLSVEEVAQEWFLESPASVSAFEWSAGLPALVDYWNAVTGRPGGVSEPSSELVREAAFVDQLDYLAELGLLPALAQHVLGPIVDDFPVERSLLKAFGLLPTAAQGELPGLSADELMQDLLRARTRDAEAWGRFGAAENRLRELVDATLSDALGVNWADTLPESSRVARRVIDAARAMQQRDANKYGHAVSWLAYTYPGELWLLMQDKWHLFGSALPFGDKAYWRERIEGLASLRAPMAHNRGELLSASQRAKVLGWADDVLRATDPPVALD